MEKNYLRCRSEGSGAILPLVMDLTNPSPSLGWSLRERDSLLERAGVDVVLALALIHHLAISNNVPLEMAARFFASAGERLVIEFVPKEDSQVRRLLATREDVFPHYTREGFERAFGAFFELERGEDVEGTCRRLYLMRRREAVS